MTKHQIENLVWREVIWVRPYKIEAVWELLSHLAATVPRGAVLWEVRGRYGKASYLLGADGMYIKNIEEALRAHGNIQFHVVDATKRTPVDTARQLKASHPSLSLKTDITGAVIRAGLAALTEDKSGMHGVRYILHNEKYTGDLLLQKRYRLDHITKKIMENRGERPQYFVKNSHEPIISREDFEEVQKELERRMEKFGITREPPKTNLFTGLIRCGLCGKKFRHKMSNAVHPCRKAVWCCGTFNVYGKDACPAQQIPEDILITKTAQIIGLEGFSREMLLAHVKEILVPGHNRLVYILHDGRTEEISWQHKSRRESWTPEMRQKARERELERIRQKKEEDK